MTHKDIAYVPPQTNVCPECNVQHRLMNDDFVNALERLGATPEQIAMLQEESDDLAAAYGVENDPHTAKQDEDAKRAGTRERVRRHREKKRQGE